MTSSRWQRTLHNLCTYRSTRKATPVPISPQGPGTGHDVENYPSGQETGEPPSLLSRFPGNQQPSCRSHSCQTGDNSKFHMSSCATPESMFSARDMAEDITLAVELKFLMRQDLSDVRARYGDVRPFVPHRPEESRRSMTESETRLQRDNWEAVARAIDALPGVSATTSHEVKAQSLEHAHYWKTHWIVSTYVDCLVQIMPRPAGPPRPNPWIVGREPACEHET